VHSLFSSGRGSAGSTPTRNIGPRGGTLAGYTLIELMVVVGLIMLVMAMAVPHLAPAIAFAGFEGSARHLANYGRVAMAYAAVERERITVVIDLDKAEYWATRWSSDAGDLFEDEAMFEEEDLFEDKRPADFEPFYFGERDDLSEDEAEERALEMRERFERMVRLSLEARARNVRHEGLFSDEPLFSDDPMFSEFTLDLDGEADDHTEEVKDDLLLRTALPHGVIIESVQMGAAEYFKGMVEIEISSLGLGEPVVFYIKNEKEEYYTVAWDAITGGAHLYEGKELEPW